MKQRWIVRELSVVTVECRHTNFNSPVIFFALRIFVSRLAETMTPLGGTFGFRGTQFENHCPSLFVTLCVLGRLKAVVSTRYLCHEHFSMLRQPTAFNV